MDIPYTLESCPFVRLVWSLVCVCSSDVSLWLVPALQVGESLIQAFLGKVKSLPVTTMTDEEVKAELKRMKEELVSQRNGYITQILSRCAPSKTESNTTWPNVLLYINALNVIVHTTEVWWPKYVVGQSTWVLKSIFFSELDPWIL